MKERLKSPIVWISIIAQISLIIAVFNKTISDDFKVIGVSLIEILTLIGILNNPSSNDKF